jgi:hypothetical protein
LQAIFDSKVIFKNSFNFQKSLCNKVSPMIIPS